MSISAAVSTILMSASAKALATSGPQGVNVVPVSMIKVNDDSIWLFDFFMHKTAENIQANSEVSLVAWSDLTGVQVKATAEYIDSGELFDTAVTWVKEENPERITKGLIVLTPAEVFDISLANGFAASDLLV